MTHDIVTAIGVIAATATIVQTTIGQGGQLRRINRSTATEIRGIHCGAFALNSMSHGLWALFGLGTANLVILLPNVLGAVISTLTVVRVVAVRSKADGPAHQPLCPPRNVEAV